MRLYSICAKQMIVLVSFVLLSVLTGCSAIEKSVYFAPDGGKNWAPNEKRSPKSYLFACGEQTIEVMPSCIELNILSVGPPFLPIFPTFGVGDNKPVTDEISIFYFQSIQGVRSSINNSILSISIPPNRDIRPKDQKEDKVVNSNFSQATFAADLDTLDAFVLNIVTSIEGCKVSPLTFKKVKKYRLVHVP